MDMSIGIYTFAHMITFLGAAPLRDTFRVEAVAGGFGIKQDGVVLAGVPLERASSGLVVPDNLTFEAWTLAPGAEAEDLVEEHFGVVGNAPVEMHIEASILGQETVQEDECFV